MSRKKNFIQDLKCIKYFVRHIFNLAPRAILSPSSNVEKLCWERDGYIFKKRVAKTEERSCPLEMFLENGKYAAIILRHGCSHVDLLHIFRRPFYKNTSKGLLLGREETNKMRKAISY